MATTAADPVFVDANIFVYTRVSQSPFHTHAVAKLRDLNAAGHPIYISRQILREYLASMTRPGTVIPPPPIANLIADVQFFETKFAVVEDGPAATARLLLLLSTIACGGKQVHDANIVATMLAHGIPNLLTHNIADFQRFSGHITLIPLVP